MRGKWSLIVANGCLPLAMAAALLVAGCIEPAGRSRPDAKKPSQDRVSDASSLEQLAFESFQQRDRLRAQKLRALKGTKYDVKRQDAIAEAGAAASEESWAPVREALSRKLAGIPQSDQAAFDAVIEDLARGADRAGK